MDATQLAGSEPEVKVNDAGDAELSWGRWLITAWVEARASQGDLVYKMILEFHGDWDAGERGMYGQLSTGFCGSPQAAADRAFEAMAFHVYSLHQEENEDDWNDHERTLNLRSLLDLATKIFDDSIAADRLAAISSRSMPTEAVADV